MISGAVPLERIRARLAAEGLLAEAEPPPAEIRVADLSADSRSVEPGGLFCAITGTGGDGHAFLGAVAAQGAAAALVERRDPNVDLRQIRVRDGRRAAAFAAAEFFGDPWKEMVVVGLTGTNGKTTTAAILRHLLATRSPAASIGTLGAVGPNGAVIPGTEALTTPGPVEVARWLRRLADDGVASVAMEVSSHALHQHRAAAVRFDAALFTNLSRDHLDYHPTMEEYRAAKLGLIDLLKPDGAAVLNADDPAWVNVDVPDRRTVRFSMDPSARCDVCAEQVAVGTGGMKWTLRTPDGVAEVHLPLFGGFNVANAVGAAAVLWSLGWPAGEIAAGLATLPQVPGRLERVVGPPEAATTLIDYAHTPDALERALLALRPLTSGRVIVVFGAGGDRDRGKRTEMGRVAAAHADLSIVTSDNPRTEDPDHIADEIERGMGDAPRVRLLDRREAIARALQEAGEDDLVLLAGKGHETYQIWGTETRPFDERVVIREILAARGTPEAGEGA